MIPRRLSTCKNRTNLLKNFTAKPWPLKSLAHSAACGVGESACQKSLAEFAARRRQRNKIIFSRDMCVRENTARAASVEFVRHRRTNYARSRPQAFCRKNPEGFSTVSDRPRGRSLFAGIPQSRLRRARADCQASATLFDRKSSVGESQPRHFLGRELIRSTT